MENQTLVELLARLKQMEESLNDDSLDNDFNVELEEMLNKINTLDDSLNPIQTTSVLNVKIKKLHEDAVVPTYAKDGDAGMDLIATSVSESIEQITYGTGISLEIPYGYVGLVFPRSSIRKYDLSLSNSVGVIDSGYRGEIMVVFNKKNPWYDVYKVGERVAQIIIMPYPKVNFVLSDELSDTERGEGGFGSTGT